MVVDKVDHQARDLNTFIINIRKNHDSIFQGIPSIEELIVPEAVSIA